MAEIKAIPTKYNGYSFRSRTEARWAVFFDAMGIKYEYEVEGYQLSNGSHYLPDFQFPNSWDLFQYAEVKPPLNDKELHDQLVGNTKFHQFSMDMKKSIILLDGPPDLRLYYGSVWNSEDDKLPTIMDVTYEFDQAQGEKRFFVFSGYADRSWFFKNKHDLDIYFSEKMINSVNRSRSAKF